MFFHQQPRPQLPPATQEEINKKVQLYIINLLQKAQFNVESIQNLTDNYERDLEHEAWAEIQREKEQDNIRGHYGKNH